MTGAALVRRRSACSPGAAVQKHVAVLERAGLVTKHPHGRERLVRGNLATIHRAQALLDSYEQLWRSRVSRLDALLHDDR